MKSSSRNTRSTLWIEFVLLISPGDASDSGDASDANSPPGFDNLANSLITRSASSAVTNPSPF